MTRTAQSLRAGLVVGFLLLPALSLAQTPAPAAADTPPQVRALLDLLADPAVRTWLDRQHAATPPPVAVAQAAPGGLSGALERIDAHLTSLLAAVPRIPIEVARAGQRLMAEFQSPDRNS